MVGGIAFDEDVAESGRVIEWLVQIEKKRSLTEKLLGREKIDANDPFVQKVFDALSEEESFSDVEWG